MPLKINQGIFIACFEFSSACVCKYSKTVNLLRSSIFCLWINVYALLESMNIVMEQIIVIEDEILI